MSGFQNAFTAALLDPELDTPKGVVDPDGRPAGKRFDVYRNNVVHSLIEAMGDAFPAVKKIVGDQFFEAMAGMYVRKNPPSSPIMMFYGESLPAFLADFEPAQSMPYLPDVAELELERRSCYHAADTVAVDASILSEITPDALMSARFKLAPSLRLMQSSYPVHSIWHFNMVSQFKITNPQEWIMLTRPEMDVVPYILDQATYAFISALKADATLEQALDSATKINDAFNLSEAFALTFQSNIVTDVII